MPCPRQYAPAIVTGCVSSVITHRSDLFLIDATAAVEHLEPSVGADHSATRSARQLASALAPEHH
jgi:hypothetical protein